MQKKIILAGLEVVYTVRRSTRARNLRMTMEYDGSLVVTSPNAWFDPFVERFLRKHASWILRHTRRMKKLEGKTVIKFSKKEYAANKKKVLAIVQDRIKFFNAFYKFRHGRISIRNQTSLWGSCTRQGNLQFNYKLIYLPPKTIDYLIVHELCHLKEHNHSWRFWALVGKMIPDYKTIRKTLHHYVMQEG